MRLPHLEVMRPSDCRAHVALIAIVIEKSLSTTVQNAINNPPPLKKKFKKLLLPQAILPTSVCLQADPAS